MAPNFARQPPASRHGLRSPLEHRGAVQPQVDQENHSADHADEENRAGGSRRSLEFARRCARFIAGNCMRVRFEQYQSESGNHRGARRVEKPLEKVQAEHVGDGQSLFARQQQWPDRLTRASQQENRREPRQSQPIDRPEIRRAKIGLEDLPARRAQSVAGVNPNQ